MIAKRILSCIKGKQKGDVFVMVAASMAAVMFCGAAVIDLGSLYAHKSELQNAADAAALAGARAMADNEETIDEHPEADNIAETYVERNLGEGSSASHTFKARSKNNAIYYRVVLEDDAPTYFYRYFFKTPPRISVEAIASINETMTEKDNGGNSSGSGEDVFIFSDEFSIDGSTSSRGADALFNQDTTRIESTFDGNIKWTDGTGEYHPEYLPKKTDHLYDWDGHLNYYYTSKGKNEDLSPKQIENMGEARFKNGYAKTAEYMQYDMDELGRYVKAQLNLPSETVSQPDWRLWGTDPQKAQEQQTAYDNYLSNFTNVKSFTSSQSDMSKNIVGTSRDGNIDPFVIDSTIPGDPNDPVYVYIDPSVSNNINVTIKQTASNYNTSSRPIVFCYTGTGMLKLNIESGTEFRGVIYAPHMSDEGIVLNGDNIKFEGTIIAKSIFIHGKNGTYKANSFGIPCLSSNSSGGGNGGSSGNKTSGNESTPTKNIHLSDPPDDINWDD